MDTAMKVFVAIVVVFVIIFVLMLVMKKDNRNNMRHRAPLMLGRNGGGNGHNGRVVAPGHGHMRNEGFIDQYTMNVPISVEQDPLFMNSIPSQSPWIGTIPNGY
jgi:hypothetical protein